MEKLDFPMKNLQALGKGEILAKRFRETGKGKETSFLTGIPTYRKARAVLLLKE